MSKEYITGISFDETASQVVVLEQQEDGLELKYLEESPKGSDKDIWFLDSFPALKERFSASISKVSIAMNNASTFLYSGPIDSSLTQSEQNEQVHWELSNYIDDFKPKDYITELHILRTKAREQISEVLTVSVKRSLLFNIQNVLSENKIDLQTVDTNHFGAQNALLFTHPDIKARTIGLIGVNNNRIDIGIIQNGKLFEYRYNLFAKLEDGMSFIEEVIKDSSVSEIFLYGSAATFDFKKSLRSYIGIIITSLNPFRRIRISSSLKGFDKYIGNEHRFASSIGIALMK